MNYRIRVTRVQQNEQEIRAPDEETAIERVRSKIDHLSGFVGPWVTIDLGIDVLGARSRVESSPTDTPESSLAMSVKGAAEQLGISRSLMYELIYSGEVEHLRVGRRVLVSRHALQKFIEAHSQLGH